MIFNFFKKNEIEASPTSEVKETVEILLRYSYEWNEDVPLNERNSQDHPSRPFCAKLLELDRLYSRSDIETISERLGYSVWDRRGGDNCRHNWVANTVVRKKK